MTSSSSLSLLMWVLCYIPLLPYLNCRPAARAGETKWPLFLLGRLLFGQVAFRFGGFEGEQLSLDGICDPSYICAAAVRLVGFYVRSMSGHMGYYRWPPANALLDEGRGFRFRFCAPPPPPPPAQ